MAIFRKKLGPKRHGEDLLSALDSLVLKLENGEIVTVRIEDELAVPDDPEDLYREARRAPARLAFWAYQEARALARLRAKERKHAACEGADYLLWRTYIQEHTQVEMATEGNIRARVAHDPSSDLKSAKDELEEAQKSYGVLRALKEAAEHRSHLLRRLIAHDTEVG